MDQLETEPIHAALHEHLTTLRWLTNRRNALTYRIHAEVIQIRDLKRRLQALQP